MSEARKIHFAFGGPDATWDLAKELEKRLDARDATVRLSPGVLGYPAFRLHDVKVTHDQKQQLERWLRPYAAVDYAEVPDRRPIDNVKRGVLDMDGTVITVDSAAELRKYVPGAEEREMELRKKRDSDNRSVFDMESKRERTRAAYAGLSMDTVDACVEHVLRSITPGAPETISTLRKYGCEQHIASGGFTLFTRPVKDALGLDGEQAIELEVDEARRVLTGEIKSGTVDPDAKVKLLRKVCEGLPPGSIVYVIGDGKNDVRMFLAAQQLGGVAFAYNAWAANNKKAHRFSPLSAVEEAATVPIRHFGFDWALKCFVPAA